MQLSLARQVVVLVDAYNKRNAFGMRRRLLKHQKEQSEYEASHRCIPRPSRPLGTVPQSLSISCTGGNRACGHNEKAANALEDMLAIEPDLTLAKRMRDCWAWTYACGTRSRMAFGS